MNNINKIAKVTALLYLSMIPFGVLGILYVPGSLLVPGDVTATMHNIMANEGMFRLAILAALIGQVVQIALVLALYKLLHVVNKLHAVLMVAFIIPAVAISMLNELNNIAVLALLYPTAQLAATFSVDQLYGLADFFLHLHEQGIMIAQIFWGLWLFPMGYLVYRSGYIPRIIGILLMIGCFGYLLDSLMLIWNPAFPFTFSEYTFLGEVLLPLWLLFKGVNVEKWKQWSEART